MKKDVVCGMDVKDDTKYTTLHGGRKLFFCSNGCRNEFLHKPDKYGTAGTGETAAAKGGQKAA